MAFGRFHGIMVFRRFHRIMGYDDYRYDACTTLCTIPYSLGRTILEHAINYSDFQFWVLEATFRSTKYMVCSDHIIHVPSSTKSLSLPSYGFVNLKSTRFTASPIAKRPRNAVSTALGFCRCAERGTL